eukprot:TRINITY_DN4769_c0_g1_i1.p1 TRINITY_DN4769_c0_g1~~TRINITY_DN4769_c0_g1_i1.p1  ORF type:complete len:921 (-),score=222.56 TRINITY_DN4769_c0_g1_i1:24-2786(-)
MNKSLFLILFIFFVHFSLNQEPELDIEHGWLKEDLIKDEFTPSSKKIENFDMSEEKWLASHNLQTYFEIFPVKKISIPIYINLIFLGFDGDGNDAIQLVDENLELWFEHVTHQLPHIVLPVGEEQTNTKKIKMEDTKLDYIYSINVIKLDPMVNTIIEDVLVWGVRDEYNTADSKKGNICYVDSYRVTTVLHSLLDHLKLTKSYTLFVMNPKKPLPQKKQQYGYRTGFSQTEIDTLYNSTYKYELVTLLNGNKYKGDQRFSKLPPIKESLEKGEQGKVTTTNFQYQSLQWAKWYVSTYSDNDNEIGVHDFIPKACRYERDEEDRDIRCVSLAKTEHLDIYNYTKHLAKFGADHERKYLRDIIERGNYAKQECLVDAWVSHERFAFIDLSAGPFNWGPLFVAEGVKTEDTFPLFPKLNQTSEAHSKRVEKQMNTLKKQYSDMCFGDDRETNSFVCDSLTEKIRKLSKEAIEEKNFFFGVDGNKEEMAVGNTQLDYWLSDLGALISSSLRHVFSPGVPLFRTHFSERVSFDIFVISDHDSFDPLGENFFEMGEFKKEMLRFKLKQQEFSFNVKLIKMSEDPYVSIAFQNSLKSSVLPDLNADGSFTHKQQLYIDSKEVRRQLRSMYRQDQNLRITEEQKGIKKGGKIVKNTRHIPVYIFSVNYDTPVLVDKYYQAKALQNMVVAVQSNFFKHQTRIQCNDQTINWDLRNPLRQILSSCALTLGGVVPPHISYSKSRQRATQQWLWSIGDNPFSHTSHSYRFSTLHKDIICRNYITIALEESIEIVNEGIEILKTHRTTHINWDAQKILNKKAIKESVHTLRTLWKKAVSQVSYMQWESAVGVVKQIQTEVNKFKKLIFDTSTVLDIYRCPNTQDHTKSNLPEVRSKYSKGFHWMVPTLIFSNILAAVSYFIFKQRSFKLKIN